jgi:hypothetical protein
MKTLIISALLVSLVPAASGQTAEQSIPGANEVMARMFARDRQRETLSQGYAGSRRYILDNQRFHKHAELLVTVKCDSDGTKHFEVVAEEGWKSANNRVLRKMLESETETSRPVTRPKTRLTPDNYDFTVVGNSLIEGRPAYVIGVIPKRPDKYLFQGEIWVDANDYALVQAEGKPARNPSFWTRNIHFVHQYRKSGSFWFPHSTESVTQALIFGTTEVTIQYFDYTPNAPPALDSPAQRKTPVNGVTYVGN